MPFKTSDITSFDPNSIPMFIPVLQLRLRKNEDCCCVDVLLPQGDYGTWKEFIREPITGDFNRTIDADTMLKKYYGVPLGSEK